jgi:hypothetical protein
MNANERESGKNLEKANAETLNDERRFWLLAALPFQHFSFSILAFQRFSV